MSARNSASDGCDGEESQDLSPAAVATARLSGAGRVAEFVRSTSSHLNVSLDRALGRNQKSKLIGASSESGAKFSDLAPIAEAMEQRPDIRPADLKVKIQLSRSCEPVASKKVASPLVGAFSCAHESAQDDKIIIFNHERSLKYTRKYSRKLNELLRSSLLVDIMPVSPASKHKAAIIKFSHHQTQSKAQSKLDHINPTHFCPHSTSERGTKLCRDSPSRDPDVDGGYAWVILAVIFVINASTFGIARAQGLIFDKLARDYQQSRSEAALPFTIMGAVENMAGPLSGYLLAQWSNSWRTTVLAGSCLISLAHFLTAFSIDSQAGQLLSMGLLGGLGTSLVSISFFQLNNAYFVRYRSTAFGIGMTGAAFGTLYISPLCQYCLDNFGLSACYLMLGAILLPNVPLSLLLKPKLIDFSHEQQTNSNKSKNTETGAHHYEPETEKNKQQRSESISERVDELAGRRRASLLKELGVWQSVKQVISNPLFHLIWPTQLLFCWLNFVFSMIIVDFGKDRGMSTPDLTKLIPCWAFGQLVGRLCLSSLVDFKCLSYKSFTVICLMSISTTLCLMSALRLPTADEILLDSQAANYAHPILLVLIFCLSMFIALLYILFNGLVVKYVEPSLQSLSIGISSFAGSFFLLPRAYIIGLYRQTSGNYDGMLTMFSLVTLAAALVWLLLPPGCSYLKQLIIVKRRQLRSRSRALDNLRVYSSWKLAQQQAATCRHRDILEPATHASKIDLNPNFFPYHT